MCSQDVDSMAISTNPDQTAPSGKLPLSVSENSLLFEPRHEKTCLCYIRTTAPLLFTARIV